MYYFQASPLPTLYNSESKLWIPVSEENPDYQAFLAWQAEGNIPEPLEALVPGN